MRMFVAILFCLGLTGMLWGCETSEDPKPDGDMEFEEVITPDGDADDVALADGDEELEAVELDPDEDVIEQQEWHSDPDPSTYYAIEYNCMENYNGDRQMNPPPGDCNEDPMWVLDAPFIDVSNNETMESCHEFVNFVSRCYNAGVPKATVFALSTVIHHTWLGDYCSNVGRYLDLEALGISECEDFEAYGCDWIHQRPREEVIDDMFICSRPEYCCEKVSVYDYEAWGFRLTSNGDCLEQMQYMQDCRRSVEPSLVYGICSGHFIPNIPIAVSELDEWNAALQCEILGSPNYKDFSCEELLGNLYDMTCDDGPQSVEDAWDYIDFCGPGAYTYTGPLNNGVLFQNMQCE